MIYLTGDTHGGACGDLDKLNSKNFLEGRLLTKKDYVIICGDFGLVWYGSKNDDEEHKLNWLNDKPWTTLFIDGNHENFERLYTFPEIEMFGSKVRKIKDSIYHLNRSEIYIIDGYKFFTMGGAESIDKLNRVEHISWWKEEMPSYVEYSLAIDNLNKANNEVDFIVTHTGPMTVLREITNGFVPKFDPLSRFFDTIKSSVKFKRWYFGHLHDDQDLEEFTCLYERVLKLDA